MSRSLPSRPNLEQLRKQAKDLRKAHRRGNASVCSVLRHLRRFSNSADEDILRAKLSLSEAQHALAREYGHTSWAALVRTVKDMAEAHVAQRLYRPLVVIGRTAGTSAGSPEAGKDFDAWNAVIKCSLCDKATTVHLTEWVEGRMLERHFCEDHAAEQLHVPGMTNEFLYPVKHSLEVAVTQEQIERGETVPITLPNGTVLSHLRLSRKWAKQDWRMFIVPRPGESEKYRVQVRLRIIPTDARI